MPNFYCFLGVSIHDCRDSQPSSGWLRKVGVLDFRFRLPDCYCFLGVSIHDCRDSQPSSGWLKKVSVLISFHVPLPGPLAKHAELPLLSHNLPAEFARLRAFLVG